MSNEDLPSINDIVEESNLPSYKEFIEVKEEEELPSVKEYIEEKVVETLEEEDIETVLSETAPEWSELVRLVNDVRKDIPEIPEIKYYDEQLKELSDKLSQIQDLNEDKLTEIESKIPELPEVKYYDADIKFIYDKIGRIKEEINSLPEVKYYENDLNSLKSRIEEVNQNIPTFPDWIQEVQEVPDFSWIGKTFSIIDDDFNKVQGHLDLIREKIDYQVSELNETIGKKEFELNIDIKNVDNSISDTNTYLNETKDKIYKELKDSSIRIWEHHKEFKDDDRKLKKSIVSEQNKLKQSLQKQIKEIDSQSVKADEALLKFFNELSEEVKSLPEVKSYDEDISKVNKNITSIKKELKELSKLASVIKTEQVELKENYLFKEPPEQIKEEEERSGDQVDPLTPMDQNFVTFDQLQSHYRLFINRVQQQLSTLGGGGEVRLEFLDDIDRSTAKVDGKFLKYDSSLKKWVGATGGVGAAGTLGIDSVGIHTTKVIGINTTSAKSGVALFVSGNIEATGIISSTSFVGPVTGNADTASNLTGSPSINVANITASGNISVAGTLTYEDVTNIDSIGIVTARTGVRVLTGTATTALVVEGNARVTGILTVGSSSLTLDGTNNVVNVGTALTLGHTNGIQFHTQNLHSQGFEVNNVNASGIVTATSGFVGNLTGDVTGTATTATNLNNQAASYYLDYDNFSNKPTIPTNNNELTNGAGFITGSDNTTGTSGGLTGTPDIIVDDITAGSVNVSGVSTFGNNVRIEGSTEDETTLTFKNTAVSGNVSAINFEAHAFGGIATSRILFDWFGSEYGSGSHGLNYVSGRGSFANHFFRNDEGNIQLSIRDNGNVSIGDHTPTSKLDVSGDVNVTGIIKGYEYTVAPYGSTTTITVTVASKTTAHRYNGTGSSSGYVFDGLESPFITLTPGRTYKFDQADSSNNSHQIKFYLEADKTTLYEGGVTYNGTAGSAGAYTQIVVGDETPTVLHYMCVNHGYMGNAVQVNSNKVDTPYQIDGLKGANITGVTTSTSFVKSSNSGGFLKADGTEDTNTYLTSYTETDPVVGAINGIVKSNGSGTISAASAGTDYLIPSGDGSSLTGLTGASADTYGSSGATPVIVVDSDGRITGISTVAISGGGTTQNLFETIAVSGQSDVVADSATDTLTLVAGSNMTITTNAGGDSITFASSGGGGGGGISNVVEDTTPQLGGNLDLNSNDITGTGNANITGAVTATSFSGNLTGSVSTGDGFGNGVQIGAGNDLYIYETGSDVGIAYQRTGTLFIRSDGDTTIDKNGSKRLLAHSDGAVDLYYANSKKLETTNTGVTVTGTLGATAVTGDGSALTGVVTSITAGSNITLTGGPDGAVTIAASGGGGSSGPDPVIMGMIF